MKELAICLVCNTVLKHENADCNCTRIAELEAEVEEWKRSLDHTHECHEGVLAELGCCRRRMVLLRAERDDLRADRKDLVRKYKDQIDRTARAIIEKEKLNAELAEANGLLDEAVLYVRSFAGHCRATGYRQQESKELFKFCDRAAKRKGR